MTNDNINILRLYKLNFRIERIPIENHREQKILV